ncbi:MAG: Ribosomal RNA small subunit methyltransferase A [Paracidovorax wautersii]|uniref:Ribosomal RNA small subunit methyltransferase A n=1 Tax=Paracidovorax wautersii TaxID=1177982 RepID=A0A7V8FKM0_9BURK|nr:MAG: Ribosomal RNA small subunit methyltransferase A [Paracidovorax wautersii]
MRPARTAANARHFDRLYLRQADPWQVATDWYECRKRALLLAALPRPRYAAALEPGCGQGELTLALAARCDQVWAVDFSAQAIARLRQRLTAPAAQRVSALQLQVPEQLAAWWPRHAGATRPDLIVVSELAYYLAPSRLETFIDLCQDLLADGGDLVFCHSRLTFGDRQQPTDAIHARVGTRAPLRSLGQWTQDDFRIEAWRRRAREPDG